MSYLCMQKFLTCRPSPPTRAYPIGILLADSETKHEEGQTDNCVSLVIKQFYLSKEAIKWWNIFKIKKKTLIVYSSRSHKEMSTRLLYQLVQIIFRSSFLPTSLLFLYIFLLLYHKTFLIYPISFVRLFTPLPPFHVPCTALLSVFQLFYFHILPPPFLFFYINFQI